MLRRTIGHIDRPRWCRWNIGEKHVEERDGGHVSGIVPPSIQHIGQTNDIWQFARDREPWSTRSDPSRCVCGGRAAQYSRK